VHIKKGDVMVREIEHPKIAYKWAMDKNINDFVEIAQNLLAENHRSRGEAFFYLIERVKIAEAKVKKFDCVKCQLCLEKGDLML
jgi:hypothetical protein